MKVLHVLLSAVLLLPLSAFPADGEGSSRPKIGLALSGGGARGSAHIGVLQALDELGVPVDYIAGTSMGAIIGGLYASGYSVAEINEILTGMDWEWAMLDRPDRTERTMRAKELEAQVLIPYRIGFNDGRLELPLGLIEGQHLDQVFREILLPVIDTHDFDDLPVPFRAIATDLVTGDEVILSGGSLPDALRASMSVPGVFAPVTIGEQLLIDGGMSNNLPVNVVRAMGADIVIAVDISSQFLSRENLTSVLSVTEQLSNFLTRRTTEAQMASMTGRDLLIVPDLGNFSAADFWGSVEIIDRGYQATMKERQALSVLAVGPPPSREGLAEKPAPEYVAHWVDLENDSVLNDEIILSRVSVKPGQPLDLRALDRDVDRIYSLDVFKSVTYDLAENEEGESGVIIKAQSRDWGPNYLQFGLELSSDFSGNSDFKLGAAYTRNALNSLGGELRVVGTMGRDDEISFDFYQPIDTRARWFVETDAYWTRENFNYWVEDENLAEVEIAGWGTDLSIGRNFDTMNRLKLNYGFARGEANVITGNPDVLEDVDIDIGELELQYIHDSLDSNWFPTRGMLHKLEYLYASDSLGASLDYRQVSATGGIAYSSGKNTALLNYEFGYSFDDVAPIERWYRLGGLGRLSGLAPNQLLGRHVSLATLAYYYRLNNLELVSTFAGFTLEAGNVWGSEDDVSFDDLSYSGSLFLGLESPLGPVYFAVGYNDSDNFAAYFYVGNPFRESRFD